MCSTPSLGVDEEVLHERRDPMSFRASLSVAFAVVLAFALSTPASAGNAKEAGPEDGILCCNGLVPFLFSGEKVLTATGRAGIFRSDNRGERWKRSMDGLVGPNDVSPFTGFVCNAPSKPNVVYALGGTEQDFSPFNGLFSSDDFGDTWKRRGEVDTGLGFNLCAVDATDPRTVYVSGFDSFTFESKTWRSADGGKTVQEISSLLPACAVGGLVRAVPGSVYVAGACIVVSTDGGATFDPVPSLGAFVAGFDVSPDGRAIFLGALDSTFSFIGTFRSTDGGASYVATTGLPFGFDVPLGFDPTNSSRIYAADGFALHVSNDGGLTFTALPNDPRFLGSLPLVTAGVDRRGSVYVAGNSGPGPFRSDDGGSTYRSIVNGFRASSVQDLAFDADGKLLVGVLHTQVVFRQTNDSHFDPLGTSLIDPNGTPGITVDTASVAGSPIDPNLILAALTDTFGLAFTSPLLRTDNGGQSWTPATVEGDPEGLPRSRIAFATPSRVYLTAPFSGLYRSDDAGQSFANLSPLPFGALAVDPTDPDTLYVGTFGDGTGLFKSTNGGQTLQSLNHTGDFSALLVDRQNPQVIYAGESFGQLLRSRDGGQTFTSASKGLAGAGVHGIAQDSKGTLYVWLRGGGLFSSKDGAKWKKVDTDEALERSGVEAGRGTLVADPRHPGRLYLGNAGVIQVDD
jgi:photosystem II stability/assembly factor-like uncharacterized protein